MRRAAKIDLSKKYLGMLCKRGHDYKGKGLSLRKKCDRSCVICCRENALARYRHDPKRYMSTRNKYLRRLYDAKWKKQERRRNPLKIKIKDHAYYAANSIRISIRNRVYRAFKMFTVFGKQYKCGDYGIDISAIVSYIGPCPGFRKEWHIDHIKPLASFNFEDAEQIKAAFAPSNHQWLSASDNLRKHTKYA